MTSKKPLIPSRGSAHNMGYLFENQLLSITGSTEIISEQTVQTLWDGYGVIKRFRLKGGKYPSVIVKHIQRPKESHHPKGWDTKLSHKRKLKSYQVEKNWYQHLSLQTNQSFRVPEIYNAIEEGSEILLIMEDLDASGYSIRLNPESVTLTDAKMGLRWLACFHAKYMKTTPKGLWPIGTYWHLDTRPDEWAKMGNRTLQQAAKAIDNRLNTAKFQTLVHGDAKLANFCFHINNKVAAVDFQYVGKGCGMKDVAYFISSCFTNSDCEKYEATLLNYYFNQLEERLDNHIDIQALIYEWKSLYAFAWADFYRFLDGWSPGHWKLHGYSKRLTQQALDELNA